MLKCKEAAPKCMFLLSFKLKRLIYSNRTVSTLSFVKICHLLHHTAIYLANDQSNHGCPWCVYAVEEYMYMVSLLLQCL